MIPCISIGILVCVSLEKYIAVLHPLLALKLLTNKLRIIMMLAIWILSIGFNLPYYFTTKEFSYGEARACIREMNGYGWLTIRDMITASFIIWYCIPLGTIAYLYTRIGLVLWNSGLKPLEIRYSSGKVTDSYGGPPTLTINYENESLTGNGNSTLQRSNSNGTQSKIHDHTSINSDVLETRKRIIRLLIAIVCSFAVLTLPHHARLLYTMWSETYMCNSTPAALLQPFAYLALFMSSGVNPLLYAFMSQRFREAVRDIANCRTGSPQRKYTRTRTFVSDIPEVSRSPSFRDNGTTANGVSNGGGGIINHGTNFSFNNHSTSSDGNTLTVNNSLRIHGIRS
uniref:G-protein coupled receptors family 1 profile domain-containing protein n=1 Tax=Panagrolaimus davidi TaxID=227884 RepID=A0A914PLC9_9BILA